MFSGAIKNKRIPRERIEVTAAPVGFKSLAPLSAGYHGSRENEARGCGGRRAAGHFDGPLSPGAIDVYCEPSPIYARKA